MCQEFVEVTSWHHREKPSRRNKADKEKATAESHMRSIVFLQTQIWQVYARHTSLR